MKSGWLTYICCGFSALALSGCVTTALPPATISAPRDSTAAHVQSNAAPADPADQLLAAAQEHALRAPPPFKLVELPSAQGTDPANNAKLKPGSSTTQYWVARGELGQYGGTLTASTFGSGPKTFCYWASDDAESGGMGELINESLIDLDPWTGKFYPRLARSFTVSPDKKEYTFVLRKGLQWSDGAPISADDVIFTLNKIIKDGYGNPSIRDTLSVDGQFPDVEKVDNLTVRVRTKQPFAPFLNGLRGMPIAPKHSMEAICKKDRALFTGFWDINCDPTQIVVSGPFKIERYVPGQRVELVRNPYYAFVDREGRRLPYLDRFVLAIVPDQNTELLKFYAGEIDILDKGSLRGSDAAQIKQRERSGNFTMFNLGADEGTVFLMFNMNRRKDPKTGKFYLDPMKQKWFNSLFFRQAVAHAINRRRLVDNILKGVGLPLYGPETPGSMYCNKSLKHYPQDMKLAADLLRQGGFVLRDGKLFDGDGNRVEFTLQTNAGNSSREGSCVMIANDLADLGIKVDFQPIDFNIMIDKTSTSCDWEAILMSLTGDKIEPYSGANIWKSSGRLHMFDQRQVGKDGFVHVTDARDWEREIDKLFDEGGTTLDVAKRHQIFDRYQQIVYDQVPYIYLYSTLDLTAMNNRIGNYNPTPLGILYLPKGSLHNVEEIYVKRKNH